MAPLGYQPYALVHTAFFLNSAVDLRANRAAATTRTSDEDHVRAHPFITVCSLTGWRSVKDSVCVCDDVLDNLNTNTMMPPVIHVML